MSYDEYKRKHFDMTEEEFHHRFGASGEVDCPWEAGSAEVACDQHTIATAMHLFVDEDTGRLRGRPSLCTFKYTKMDKDGNLIADVEVPFPDDFVGGVSMKKSPKEISYQIKHGADWAVFHMKNEVEGVDPYEVWKANPLVQEKFKRRDLISVSAKQTDTDGPTISTGCGIFSFYYPKYDPSLSKDQNLPIGPKIDCDTMPGASGGADLRFIDGNSVLVALHESGMGGFDKFYNFDRDSHYTQSILIDLAFQKAIAASCGEENLKDKSVSQMALIQFLDHLKYKVAND
jgi:hypothetical protein